MSQPLDIKIELLVQHLLHEEDCVVVPGFGGFVTNYRSAVIEPSKNIILPPSKQISFNAQLAKNDGFLAKTISAGSGITYAQALESITHRVAVWNSILNDQRYLEFEGLGSFIQDKEGNITFEQFAENNFLASSYGLSAVRALPMEQEGIVRKIEKGIHKQKGKGKIVQLNKKLIKYSAAAVLFLGLMGVGYQNQDSIAHGYDQLSLSISHLFESKASVEKPVNKAQEQVVVGSEIAKTEEHAVEVQQFESFFEEDEKQLLEDIGMVGDSINLNTIEAIQEQHIQEVEIVQPANIVSNTNSELRFHVIAGCFSVEKNATKMVKKLQNEGYPAAVAGYSKGGLIRVAYGSYATRVEALKALAKAKLNHNSNAWLAKD